MGSSTMGVIDKVKKNKTIKLLYLYLKFFTIQCFGERKVIEKKFIKRNGYIPDLIHPVRYNEKLQWLKLNYFEPFYRESCDKYLIHNYLQKKLGKDYAVPLIYFCQNVEDFSMDNITEYPCIIKVSNANAESIILHSKDDMSEKMIKNKLRIMKKIGEMQAVTLGEPQYLPRDEYIIVEKLLTDSVYGIPNDYKLLYINGELQFIYCSIERMSRNYRQIYDEQWKKLPFIWVPNANSKLFDKFYHLPDINEPRHFAQMKYLAEKIAEDFPTVRIDFYDTDDQLYIGEITIHHGSGFDRFYPDEYDELYGTKLSLPKRNRGTERI